MTGNGAAERWNPWRELREIGDDEEKGVIFGQVELPSGVAWWVPEERVILMQPGLRQVRRRCALAHELGHRHLGHTGQCRYADGPRLGERDERAADDWAARRLITLEALADALRWSDEPEEVASELWVTRRLLEVRLARMYGGERRRVGVLLRGARDEAHGGRPDAGSDAAGVDELQQQRQRHRRGQHDRRDELGAD